MLRVKLRVMRKRRVTRDITSLLDATTTRHTYRFLVAHSHLTSLFVSPFLANMVSLHDMYPRTTLTRHTVDYGV